MPGPIRIARGVGRTVVANLGMPRHYIGRSVARRDDYQLADQTVLLLHGFWQTRGVMNRIEQRLRADGYPALSFDLGGFLGNFNSRSIPLLARRVAEKLERLSERGELGSLHVVGHSKGGLVGRYLVSQLGWHRRVRTLVTLGTPHHGTPVAALGLVGIPGLVSRSVWQMLPSSSLIRELHEHPVPAGTRFVSIYSKHDLICPARYSVLTPADGADAHNRVVAGLGHMDLVEDPWVYGLIARQIAKGAGVDRVGGGARRRRARDR